MKSYKQVVAIVLFVCGMTTVAFSDEPVVADAASTSASSASSKMPAFNWDTLPLYVHVRKTDEFTPEEVRYLASFPLITFEKTTGSKAFGSTDAGTIKAAQAVRRANPDAKVLFYRNVIVHYGGYRFDSQLATIADPFLRNKRGNDKLIRGRVRAYDLSNAAVRKWWVDSMASVCQHESIDGLFLDGNVKVLSSFLERDLPQGKKAQVIKGFDQMMHATRQSLGNDKLMIANVLRARFDDGGLKFMDYFDGSYLEGFEHAVGRISKADYIAKGIDTVQQAARSGKLIALTLNVGDSSMGDGVDELRGNLESLDQVSAARVDYCIALFLVMAEQYSYLNIHDGYDVNTNANGKCASKLWMKKLPQYSRPLGPPLGPAVRNGYRYSRDFQHASVTLDIEASQGNVIWK